MGCRRLFSNISSTFSLSDQFRSVLLTEVLLRACMDYFYIYIYIYIWENQISVEATDTEFVHGGLSGISCYLIPKFWFQYFFDNCSLLVELFTYQDITAHVGLNTIQILCTLENTSELDIGLYKKLNNRYLKLNERDKSKYYLSCSGVFFFFFFPYKISV